MESIDYEQQQQIASESNKQHKKIKNFKEYLAGSQTLHHFVKFLFGLRTKQQHDESIPNGDALQMFQEYFGALTPDTAQQEQLKKQIKQIKSQNSGLSAEIEKIKQEISDKVASIEKARQEKRLRQQQQAKNPKKGGKK